MFAHMGRRGGTCSTRAEAEAALVDAYDEQAITLLRYPALRGADGVNAWHQRVWPERDGRWSWSLVPMTTQERLAIEVALDARAPDPTRS